MMFRARHHTRFGALVGLSAVVVALFLAPTAVADGSGFPHHNGGASCYMGRAFWGWPGIMLSTPGYGSTAIVGGQGFFGSGSNVNPGYTPQWLTFRVWAQSYTTGAWYAGRTLGGYGELGAHTSGVQSWVEMSPGNWRPTGQINTSNPEDVSYAQIPKNGWYYVWVEYRWGPIYTGTGALAYAGTVHNERKGLIYC